MTARRSAGLAAIGVYGGALAVAGVFAAAGLGPATTTADASTVASTGAGPGSTTGSATRSEPGRAVAPAPVVPPFAGAAAPAPAPSGLQGAVPSATEGTDIPARPAVFAPTRLVLPGGTAAPVVPVGLHPDGALAIPDDVRQVGWWTGGSKAGEAFGSVVVAGHVDSAARGIGVFAELRQLVPGQVVELDAAAAGITQAQRYRIVSAVEVPQARIAQDSGIFRVDGEPQLVLITCGGAFDRERHRYQDNLVVLATPLL
jgi:hypothetical protein